MNPPKIIIAPDSFKGSLSSEEVCDAIMAGLSSVLPVVDYHPVRIADGGEGLSEILSGLLHLTRIPVRVHDPLNRVITASYSFHPSLSVIDIAQSCGLSLLKENERDPSITTTAGAGELILDALSRGCRNFIIGLGGSATNDAGMGMLSILGFRFLDRHGNPLPPCGAFLSEVSSIAVSDVPQSVQDSVFTLACDVDSPFCGPRGAAHVFAPQKGADHDMVELLDNGLSAFADQVESATGKHIHQLPGAGAAGGLGGAFMAFLHSSAKSGIDIVLDLHDFDHLLQGADLVITGEGCLDAQTLCGKAVSGICRRASLCNVPVIALCGYVEPDVHIQGLSAAYQTLPAGMSVAEGMQKANAYRNLVEKTAEVMRSFL